MATLKPFECRYGTLEEQIWIEKKQIFRHYCVGKRKCKIVKRLFKSLKKRDEWKLKKFKDERWNEKKSEFQKIIMIKIIESLHTRSYKKLK